MIDDRLGPFSRWAKAGEEWVCLRVQPLDRGGASSLRFGLRVSRSLLTAGIRRQAGRSVPERAQGDGSRDPRRPASFLLGWGWAGSLAPSLGTQKKDTLRCPVFVQGLSREIRGASW